MINNHQQFNKIKICGSCKEIKTENDFYKNCVKKDGLGSYCKKCNTLWVKKRYLRNKEYYDNKNKEARLRNQKYVHKYLLDHPCIDCGEKDPVVLEFDHIKDKKICVSEMVRKLHALSSIQKEIEKCVIRCANCHRKKTAKERNWFKFFGE